MRSLVLAALMLPVPATAAVDVVLQFSEQIDGSSMVQDHRDWMEVSAVSWSGFRLAELDADGVRNVSQPFASELSVTRSLDGSSPQLFLSSMSGAAIPTVTVRYITAGGARLPVVFAEIELEDVVVTAYKSGVTAAADTPQESFSLHYGLIRYTVYPLTLTGEAGPPVTECFDVAPDTGPSC